YLVTGADEGNRAVREDTDIEAFWANTDNGYRVELRLPLSGIGHIVFSVTNVEHNSGGRPVATASTAKPGDAAAGRLIRSSKALSSLLSELAQQDETFEVYDTAQHRLGIGGSGMSDTGYAPQNADTFAAIDGVPRSSSGENQVRASVALTQSGKALGVLSGYQSIRAQMDDLRTWRDMTTVGAAILALVALALAAAWGKLLGSRIERVAKAFDGIIDSRGRIRGSLPATGHLDEVDKLVDTLGDASNRMAQYTDHLENLSVRLTHELRTPLTVIRSSLDNLEPANLPGEASVYVSRAGEGVRQLSSILSNMTEATRLEESLDPAEQEYFDLEEVVRGCVRGYEVAWPNRAFEVVVESKFDKIFGLPELIAQMLDKLVSNANEFGEPGTPIRVLISTGDGDAILRVINEGPSLPDQVSRHLFERMVSVRSRADGATHLGLGLYLARMIATFHGGRIDASNTPDGLGVAVTVRLPLLRMIGRRD
ncbi:MAG: hypothetical protein KDI19_08355, partial [Pseudomonadales bacterium]|nr:hypothetical protein [Pseudomonadales bacterium]